MVLPLDISTYVQLGSTVTVVVLFLNYLTKRDNKWTDSLKGNEEANLLLAKALQRLTDIIERNSNINTANTSKLDEGITAINKNMEMIDKNTNGNGKH